MKKYKYLSIAVCVFLIVASLIVPAEAALVGGKVAFTIH